MTNFPFLLLNLLNNLSDGLLFLNGRILQFFQILHFYGFNFDRGNLDPIHWDVEISDHPPSIWNDLHHFELKIAGFFVKLKFL